MVVPACYGYDPDTLHLRGPVASQSLNTAGTPACVTTTFTVGLVLARSVFEYTISHCSAMIHGQPRLVTDPVQRLAGLRDKPYRTAMTTTRRNRTICARPPRQVRHRGC
jgi:uncharacterized protein